MNNEPRRKFFLRTFGCQMNRHDSERLAATLCRAGWARTRDEGEADLLLLNTCSVREHAERRVWGKLFEYRLLKREKPGTLIAVAGCMAELLKNEIFRRVPEVDLILGPGKFDHVLSALDDAAAQPVTESGFSPSNDEAFFRLPRQAPAGVKASVTVMRGCNNFCAYCVVPFTRGRERSRPPEEIEEEIRLLVEQGTAEVVLLGQNVNSYRGRTLSGEMLDFAGLLERIDGTALLPRMRFVTSHPKDISPRLIEKVEKLRSVCEDLHFPAQSGSDRILEAMGRGYDRREYLDKVAAVRARIPGVALRSDFIVGFPGETEEDFQETLSLVEEVGFEGVFAFTYSVRPGTRASRLPDDVSVEEKNSRLQRLLALQAGISRERHRALVGQTVEVLVEGRNSRRPERGGGRTRQGQLTFFPWRDGLAGKLLRIEIEKTTPLSLYGKEAG